MSDDLRDEMRAGFKKIDNEFKKIDERFKQVDDQIKAEGETTRRYFDIVAEQFKEHVKVLADGTARIPSDWTVTGSGLMTTTSG